MPWRADAAVFDADGRMVVLVEARGKPGTDARWAAKYRSNLEDHLPIRTAGVFVIVTLDRLYAWRGETASGAPPDVDIDVTPYLRPYAEAAHLDLAALTPSGFELVVGQWLVDMLESPPRVAVPNALRTLGFPEPPADVRLEYAAA